MRMKRISPLRGVMFCALQMARRVENGIEWVEKVE